MVTQAEIDIVINARNMATAELTKLKSSLGSVSKDAASATTQMAKVGDSAGGIGSKISGATKALGAFGLAGMGISSLTGVAKGLGDALGLGLANQMEQTRAQMMAFYKDAGVVETELAKVKKEAASTPFAFQEIATAFAQLGPTAKSAGKDTLELTRIAEALAASNPMQGFEGAVFSLKEAVTGDMTSIIERFNLSRSAIKRFKDEGKTDLEAVQAAMAEQGITYDLVAAQSQTMTGRWSTFVDTINEVKMAIAAPIFEALKKSLVGMQAGLESALPALQRFGQIAGEGIAKGITLLGQAITAAAPAVKNFIAADVVPTMQAFAAVLISPVIPAVQQFATVVGEILGPPLRAVFDYISDHKEILAGVAVVIGGALVLAFGAWAVAAGAAAVATIAAAAPVLAIGAAIALLVAGIILLVKHWDEITQKFPILGAVADAVNEIMGDLGRKLADFGQTILPELVAAWQNLSDQIGTIANGIRAVVEPVFDGIRSFLEAHRTEITTIVQGTWDAIVVIVTTITGVISNAIQFWLNVLQGDWSGAWENVKNTVEIVWNGIKDLIQIAIDTIPVILRVGMAAAIVVLQAAWDLIKDTLIPGAWTAIKAAVQAGIDAVPPILRAGMQLAIEALQAAWDFVKDTLIPLAWEGIKAGVEAGIGAVIEMLKGMKDRFLAALSDIGTWLLDVGKHLIQGIIDGGRTVDLFGALKEIVENGIQGAWAAIRPGSPSEEGADIGRNFIEGIISGAGELAGALKDYLTGLAKDAVRDVGGAITGAVSDLGGAALGALGLGGGGDVDAWLKQAMQITGVDASWFEPLKWLVAHESGGNPNAVNPQAVIQGGVNYGHATGLLQTIPGTFAANNITGGSITDPVANAAAAIEYIKRVYGHPSVAVSRHAAQGGYAKGGKAPYGWGVVGEQGWERFHYGPDGLTIFPHDMSQAMGPMTGGRGYAEGTGNVGSATIPPLIGSDALPVINALNDAVDELQETLTSIPPLISDRILPVLGEVTGDIGKMTTETGKLPPLIADHLLPVLSTTESQMDLVSGASGGMAKSLDAVGKTATTIAAGPFHDVDVAIQALIDSFTKGTISAEDYDKAMQGLQATAAKIASPKGGGFAGASAVAQISGRAGGGSVPYGWFTAGEAGAELGHYGPGGLDIFSNAQSKAMLHGMGGSVRGFQGGSRSLEGSIPGGTKGNNDLAEKFAAFAAGVVDPTTWAAWLQGMQMIADWMTETAAILAEQDRQLEGLRLGDEITRFVAWVRQFGEEWLKQLLETEGPAAAFTAFHGRSTRSMDPMVLGASGEAVTRRLDNILIAVESLASRPVYVSPAEVGQAARDYETAYYRSRH